MRKTAAAKGVPDMKKASIQWRKKIRNKGDWKQSCSRKILCTGPILRPIFFNVVLVQTSVVFLPPFPTLPLFQSNGEIMGTRRKNWAICSLRKDHAKCSSSPSFSRQEFRRRRGRQERKKKREWCDVLPFPRSLVHLLTDSIRPPFLFPTRLFRIKEHVSRTNLGEVTCLLTLTRFFDVW